jgi:mRNA-degrading endonuclease RelE of RelBE toxin-antitoxin system
VAARRPRDDWPDFTISARLQFWALPPEVIEQFAALFPEFTRYPQRPSQTLDVCPVRNDPRRWRLKVGGYRALYQIRHGRPVIERILLRTNRTYQDFKPHSRRPPAD